LSRDTAEPAASAEDPDWRDEAETAGPLVEVEAAASLVGAAGVARTDLRPGGIAEIAGERIDVVSEGDYVAAGTALIVVKDESYRRVVRAIDNTPRQPSDET
jgi:membrane-bound serine protease (ClpP class)